jgi:ankyrin repeat protein
VIKLLERLPELADSKKDDGFTSLHLASLNGHFSIVATLLTKGKCNVNSCNSRKQTALHLAANQVGFLDQSHFVRIYFFFTLQGEAGVMELLVSHKANLNGQDDIGDTALHIALDKACGKPDYPVNKANCQLLEKVQFSIYLLGQNCDAVLLQFEEKNRTEFGDEYGCPSLAVISYLICMGSDLNIANNRKETAVNLVNQLTKYFPKILDVVKLHARKPSW